MPDLIYRLDPGGRDAPRPPTNAAEARARLAAGNATFTRVSEEDQVVLVSPERVWVGEGGPVPHRPFAAILGCADARVPVELVFGCASNDLFVVRVAGNVPGDECLGSLEYAVANLASSMHLAVVLGHTHCGAVTAAADTYLDPTVYPDSAMLRAVIDRILPAVRAADQALVACHGEGVTTGASGREALIELAIVLNTALAAMTVRADLQTVVAHGVFDLARGAVDLQEPPADMKAYAALAAEVAASEGIRRVLGR